MTFAADERGQSVLVGTILLFGILIIAFSSYQAFVVPNQNAEVEFNHNSEVQSDMQDLRNSLLDLRSVEDTNGEFRPVSEHRPVRVQLGTEYPARIVAVNPPSPAGTIETIDPVEPVRIEDAAVAGGEFESSPEVLLDRDLDTTFLRYRPNYNEFQDPPDTVIEHSLLYNEFRNAELTVRGQTVIRPETNRINLVLFSGDISRSSSQAVTLDPETLDGPTGTIPLEPAGDEMRIQLPTRKPEIWEDELAGSPGVNVNAEDDSITVELENEYDLRVTRVGFDGGTEDDTLTPIQLSREVGVGNGGDPLPGPRVFDADGPDEGDEPLGADDDFELTATVSNIGQISDERGGTTIQAAEWYLQGDDPGEGNAYPMETSDGEFLEDVEVDVIDDEVSATLLDEGENTLIIRGQDSRGIWGEDTDSVTVEVDESGDPMADRTDIIDAETTNEAGSIVDFTIETPDDGVVVTGLGIDYETGEGDADRVNNGGNDEVVFSGSDGRFDAGGGQQGINLGDDPVDFEDDGADGEYADLPEGTTDMTLAEFESDGSGRPEVDVSQDVFDVTLVFGDGSRDTYPIQVDG
ncbi:probable secreted glycoprotein [Natronomonas pharaonis DSM 2160]|uniref:Probable secreted glycoprotein n=1 Tax=Natronomonas pharaonis (strain ATCC 35678 / DSM 2160 / CIP 103997 / JCM 8858 / NBRC 14720 / NCIMB 2260 / Gabara) TaxID=348780 RepID=A0A1U7EZ39_NATPD|nr:hypothetical protein [Natronomonas pharaonis]CAI50512.1 probable secreted glycoprotein [Natronomonas pharaonis DSM 2160]